MKIKNIKRLSFWGSLFVGLAICLLIFSGARAQSNTVQAYSSATALQYGTIVQLQSHNSTTVVALTQANIAHMFGVVISPNQASFNLSPPTSTTTQAYVVTSGDYPVLVSDQNGSISAGDYISISAIDGVGMKADGNEQLVVGKATSAFNGSDSLSTTNLKLSNGTTKKVSIGLIGVSISVIHNPLIVSASSSGLPSFLHQASQGVTNKPVSTARLILGLIIIGISAILAGVLLYSGVRNSIVAIGRNPLSRKFVIRGLIQVTVIALIVFLTGLFGVYLLLIL